MVVVAVVLAAWICVIWWQDARTLKRLEAPNLDPEVKVERFDSKERETPKTARQSR